MTDSMIISILVTRYYWCASISPERYLISDISNQYYDELKSTSTNIINPQYCYKNFTSCRLQWQVRAFYFSLINKNVIKYPILNIKAYNEITLLRSLFVPTVYFCHLVLKWSHTFIECFSSIQRVLISTIFKFF